MITVDGVSQIYEPTRRNEQAVVALDNVTLRIEHANFFTFIGPSGCGKSTLLRLIAGMEKPTGGSISIGGESVKGADPRRVVVWQEFALMDWRTVSGNIAFGLEAQGMGRRERKDRVREMLSLVRLERFAGHYPNQLSGGMRQRVAIARALAVDPDILLMDEPFGALDAQTRQLMQEELLRIWEQWRKTVVFVTHSLDEALLLSDRIALFTSRPGQIKAVVPVPLARPRSQSVRTDPVYQELYQQLSESLRAEVQRATLEEFTNA